MQAWHDFFALLGGAGATLLGLLFVSVSLHARSILDPAHRNAKHLAEQAYHNYVAVLVVSLVVFFPGIGNYSLGLTILILSPIYALWLLVRFAQTMRMKLALDSRVLALRRYAGTFAGFVCLAVGGRQMTIDHDLHMLVPLGGLIVLILAIAISWELLIKLAEAKDGAHQ
jgi:hypothetical protein